MENFTIEGTGVGLGIEKATEDAKRKALLRMFYGTPAGAPQPGPFEVNSIVPIFIERAGVELFDRQKFSINDKPPSTEPPKSPEYPNITTLIGSDYILPSPEGATDLTDLSNQKPGLVQITIKFTVLADSLRLWLAENGFLTCLNGNNFPCKDGLGLFPKKPNLKFKTTPTEAPYWSADQNAFALFPIPNTGGGFPVYAEAGQYLIILDNISDKEGGWGKPIQNGTYGDMTGGWFYVEILGGDNIGQKGWVRGNEVMVLSEEEIKKWIEATEGQLLSGDRPRELALTNYETPYGGPSDQFPDEATHVINAWKTVKEECQKAGYADADLDANVLNTPGLGKKEQYSVTIKGTVLGSLPNKTPLMIIEPFVGENFAFHGVYILNDSLGEQYNFIKHKANAPLVYVPSFMVQYLKGRWSPMTVANIAERLEEQLSGNPNPKPVGIIDLLNLGRGSCTVRPSLRAATDKPWLSNYTTMVTFTKEQVAKVLSKSDTPLMPPLEEDKARLFRAAAGRGLIKMLKYFDKDYDLVDIVNQYQQGFIVSTNRFTTTNVNNNKIIQPIQVGKLPTDMPSKHGFYKIEGDNIHILIQVPMRFLDAIPRAAYPFEFDVESEVARQLSEDPQAHDEKIKKLIYEAQRKGDDNIDAFVKALNVTLKKGWSISTLIAGAGSPFNSLATPTMLGLVAEVLPGLTDFIPGTQRYLDPKLAMAFALRQGNPTFMGQRVYFSTKFNFRNNFDDWKLGKDTEKVLLHYQKELKGKEFVSDGYPRINFKNEIKYLKEWHATLQYLLEINDVNYHQIRTPSAPDGTPANANEQSQVEIGWDNEFNILYVLFNGASMRVGFECAVSLYTSFKRPRTSALIHRALDDKTTGNDDKPYPVIGILSQFKNEGNKHQKVDEWIATHIYPKARFRPSKIDSDGRVKKAKKQIKKLDATTIKGKSDLKKQEELRTDPDINAAIKKKIKKIKTQTGSKGLDKKTMKAVGKTMTDVSSWYKTVLNRWELRTLVEKLIECYADDLNEDVGPKVLVMILDAIMGDNHNAKKAFEELTDKEKRDLDKSSKTFVDFLKALPVDCSLAVLKASMEFKQITPPATATKEENNSSYKDANIPPKIETGGLPSSDEAVGGYIIQGLAGQDPDFIPFLKNPDSKTYQYISLPVGKTTTSLFLDAAWNAKKIGDVPNKTVVKVDFKKSTGEWAYVSVTEGPLKDKKGFLRIDYIQKASAEAYTYLKDGTQFDRVKETIGGKEVLVEEGDGDNVFWKVTIKKVNELTTGPVAEKATLSPGAVVGKTGWIHSTYAVALTDAARAEAEKQKPIFKEGDRDQREGIGNKIYQWQSFLILPEVLGGVELKGMREKLLDAGAESLPELNKNTNGAFGRRPKKGLKRKWKGGKTPIFTDKELATELRFVFGNKERSGRKFGPITAALTKLFFEKIADEEDRVKNKNYVTSADFAKYCQQVMIKFHTKMHEQSLEKIDKKFQMSFPIVALGYVTYAPPNYFFNTSRTKCDNRYERVVYAGALVNKYTAEVDGLNAKLTTAKKNKKKKIQKIIKKANKKARRWTRILKVRQIKYKECIKTRVVGPNYTYLSGKDPGVASMIQEDAYAITAAKGTCEEPYNKLNELLTKIDSPGVWPGAKNKKVTKPIRDAFTAWITCITKTADKERAKITAALIAAEKKAEELAKKNASAEAKKMREKIIAEELRNLEIPGETKTHPLPTTIPELWQYLQTVGSWPEQEGSILKIVPKDNASKRIFDALQGQECSQDLKKLVEILIDDPNFEDNYPTEVAIIKGILAASFLATGLATGMLKKPSMKPFAFAKKKLSKVDPFGSELNKKVKANLDAAIAGAIKGTVAEIVREIGERDCEKIDDTGDDPLDDLGSEEQYQLNNLADDLGFPKMVEEAPDRDTPGAFPQPNFDFLQFLKDITSNLSRTQICSLFQGEQGPIITSLVRANIKKFYPALAPPQNEFFESNENLEDLFEQIEKIMPEDFCEDANFGDHTNGPGDGSVLLDPCAPQETVKDKKVQEIMDKDGLSEEDASSLYDAELAEKLKKIAEFTNLADKSPEELTADNPRPCVMMNQAARENNRLKLRIESMLRETLNSITITFSDEVSSFVPLLVKSSLGGVDLSLDKPIVDQNGNLNPEARVVNEDGTLSAAAITQVSGIDPTKDQYNVETANFASVLKTQRKWAVINLEDSEKAKREILVKDDDGINAKGFSWETDDDGDVLTTGHPGYKKALQLGWKTNSSKTLQKLFQKKLPAELPEEVLIPGTPDFIEDLAEKLGVVERELPVGFDPTGDPSQMFVIPVAPALLNAFEDPETVSYNAETKTFTFTAPNASGQEWYPSIEYSVFETNSYADTYEALIRPFRIGVQNGKLVGNDGDFYVQGEGMPDGNVTSTAANFRKKIGQTIPLKFKGTKNLNLEAEKYVKQIGYVPGKFGNWVIPINYAAGESPSNQERYFAHYMKMKFDSAFGSILAPAPEGQTTVETYLLSGFAKQYPRIVETTLEKLFKDVSTSKFFNKMHLEQLELSPSFEDWVKSCSADGPLEELSQGLLNVNDLIQDGVNDYLNSIDYCVDYDPSLPGPTQKVIANILVYAFIRVSIVENLLHGMFVFDKISPEEILDDHMFKGFLYNKFKQDLLKHRKYNAFKEQAKLIVGSRRLQGFMINSESGVECLKYLFKEQYATISRAFKVTLKVNPDPIEDTFLNKVVYPKVIESAPQVNDYGQVPAEAIGVLGRKDLEIYTQQLVSIGEGFDPNKQPHIYSQRRFHDFSGNRIVSADGKTKLSDCFFLERYIKIVDKVDENGDSLFDKVVSEIDRASSPGGIIHDGLYDGLAQDASKPLKPMPRKDFLKGYVRIDDWFTFIGYLKDKYDALSSAASSPEGQSFAPGPAEASAAVQKLEKLLFKDNAKEYFSDMNVGMRLNYIFSDIGEDIQDGRPDYVAAIGELRNAHQGKIPKGGVAAFYTEEGYYDKGNDFISHPKYKPAAILPMVEAELPVKDPIKNLGVPVAEGPFGSQEAVDNDPTNFPLVNFVSNVASPLPGNPYATKYKPNSYSRLGAMFQNQKKDLLQAMKEKPEFKALVNFAFPMQRYAGLASIYTILGSRRVMPMNDVFIATKFHIASAYDINANAKDADYVKNKLAERDSALKDWKSGSKPMSNSSEPMAMAIMKILLTAPFLVLKGLTEAIDPNVIAAKKVYDGMNMASKTVNQWALEQMGKNFDKFKEGMMKNGDLDKYSDAIPSFEKWAKEQELEIPNPNQDLPPQIAMMMGFLMMPSMLPYGVGFPPPPLGPGVGPPMTMLAPPYYMLGLASDTPWYGKNKTDSSKDPGCVNNHSTFEQFLGEPETDNDDNDEVIEEEFI